MKYLASMILSLAASVSVYAESVQKIIKFQLKPPVVDTNPYKLPSNYLSSRAETDVNVKISKKVYDYFIDKLQKEDVNKFILSVYNETNKNIELSFNSKPREEMLFFTDKMTDIIINCTDNLSDEVEKVWVMLGAHSGYPTDDRRKLVIETKESNKELYDKYVNHLCTNKIQNNIDSLERNKLRPLVEGYLKGNYKPIPTPYTLFPWIFEDFAVAFSPYFGYVGKRGNNMGPFENLQAKEMANIVKITLNKYFINENIFKKYKDITFSSYIDFMKIIRKEQPNINYLAFKPFAKLCIENKTENLFKPFNYNKCLINNDFDEYIFDVASLKYVIMDRKD